MFEITYDINLIIKEISENTTVRTTRSQIDCALRRLFSDTPKKPWSATIWLNSFVCRVLSSLMRPASDYLKDRPKEQIIEILTKEEVVSDDIDIESNIAKKHKKTVITFTKQNTHSLDVTVHKITV